jgi:hypothetical protein
MSWPGFDGHLKRGHDELPRRCDMDSVDDSHENLNARRRGINFVGLGVAKW